MASDLRRLAGARVGVLSRRQVVAAAGAGALFGSAWAAAFQEMTADDGTPSVTVVQTQSALATLFAFHRHRILAIDAPDKDALTLATELVTGVMRQRIDVALAPHATALLIDGAFRDRWRIRHVWTLGTSPDGSGSSLGNRSIRIGDFDLHADTLPIGAWRAEPSSEIAPWYLAATFGDGRVTVASDADAVDRMPLDPQRANAVICRDGDLELPVRRAPIQMMALPADLDLDRASTGSDTIVVPLHRDTPIAIRMHRSGVGLESTV